ncbi:hybrid sensor histidine kinase/response regulator [Haloarchaeobius amylolyticus]|uniref:hybrid sensor histidine kinase/response regulator n=1 Tax=Haloarchaeobius amylolyticus TaxID=1198296 RepID=UPI00226F2CCF|nr:PAS domain S-box protein [Haloarchaeobius amylolyticus]
MKWREYGRQGFWQQPIPRRGPDPGEQADAVEGVVAGEALTRREDDSDPSTSGRDSRRFETRTLSDGDETVRVLCVDDDENYVELLSNYLEEENDRLETTAVTSAEAALSALEGTSFDCVVSDYDMPELDGLELLDRVRSTHEDLPFLLVTGKGSEEIASEAISEGVTEYLQKGTGREQFAVLANRIERAAEAYRAKQALAESERKLATLISNVPGMVYRCRNDRDWTMEFVSEGCRELTGYDPEEIESGTVSFGRDVIHPDDREDVWETVQDHLGEREPFELTYRILPKEGTRKWVFEQGRGVFEGDELRSIEGVITDVTDIKERELRFEAIFNQTFQFMGLLEPDGTILEANDTALEFGGFDREDVVGDLLWNTPWFPEDEVEHVRDLVDRAADGEFVRTEMDVIGADRLARVDFSIKPVTDEDGDVVLLVPEGRDITNRIERERELERERDRLDEFTSVVSHDLRNPLTVARTSLELAREDPDPEHFDRVERAHERIETLIDDLLTLAREGQRVEETEPVDLCRVAEAAWQTIESDDASLSVPGAEYVVEADEPRLRQLFENLFSNAVAYGGDSVRVEVGSLDGDDDGFYVADDGPGIPPEEREDVFEHGYSTADEGTGFGLSIVESIAEAHGWSIDVTEGEDGGARFEVVTGECTRKPPSEEMTTAEEPPTAEE